MATAIATDVAKVRAMSDDEPQNPIVALASRIKARRDLARAIDSATTDGATLDSAASETTEAALRRFSASLATGSKRLASILGPQVIRHLTLEAPLRVRLRMDERRLALDLDTTRELVVVRGLGLDGDYQFDHGSAEPALVNLSLLSTEAGYGTALTPARALEALARDAELPRPAHLDEGPLRF